MKALLKQKISESVSSVLPITVIVLLLSFTNLAPMPAGMLLLFILGAVMLIVGMGFFSLGTDIAMMKLGTETGRSISKTKHISLVVLICFLIGFAVTVAEPDLQVLAKQFTAVPDLTVILTVAAGVGAFLVFAVLRERIHIPLQYALIVLYILVFIVSFFVESEFLPVSFDAGGVTTGPITVPFIIALGIGVAANNNADSKDDSFGLVALCSIGPIITMLIMGLCLNSADVTPPDFYIPEITDSNHVGQAFAQGFPTYIKEVTFGLSPVMLFFVIFQLITREFSKKDILKTIIGSVYTYVGLVLFLTGVNIGFMPVGNYIGKMLAALEFNWILVPLGMLMGYFIVIAEPAVHVLNKQVEEITNGAVPEKAMMLSLSVGVAVSIGLSMLRVLTGISIYWFIIPGYAIAIILSFFVPKVFTAIAFDSGGVASGPMTATFLLPFTMGACEMLGGNSLTDAFGVVALVAMTPLITIQFLGLIYKHKVNVATDITPSEASFMTDDIIEYIKDEEANTWTQNRIELN